MPGFFAHARGTVIRMPGPHRGNIPFKVRIPGGPLSRGIITQCKIEHEGNFQFAHSIGGTVYVYIFGDKIGSLVVGGTAFGVTCGGEGVSEVIQRYNSNRIAAAGRPVTVGVAQVAFPCFLTGFSLDASDPETQLAQWALRFNIFPG